MPLKETFKAAPWWMPIWNRLLLSPPLLSLLQGDPVATANKISGAGSKDQAVLWTGIAYALHAPQCWGRCSDWNRLFYAALLNMQVRPKKWLFLHMHCGCTNSVLSWLPASLDCHPNHKPEGLGGRRGARRQERAHAQPALAVDSWARLPQLTTGSTTGQAGSAVWWPRGSEQQQSHQACQRGWCPAREILSTSRDSAEGRETSGEERVTFILRDRGRVHPGGIWTQSEHLGGEEQ